MAWTRTREAAGLRWILEDPSSGPRLLGRTRNLWARISCRSRTCSKSQTRALPPWCCPALSCSSLSERCIFHTSSSYSSLGLMVSVCPYWWSNVVKKGHTYLVLSVISCITHTQISSLSIFKCVVTAGVKMNTCRWMRLSARPYTPPTGPINPSRASHPNNNKRKHILRAQISVYRIQSSAWGRADWWLDESRDDRGTTSLEVEACEEKVEGSRLWDQSESWFPPVPTYTRP